MFHLYVFGYFVGEIHSKVRSVHLPQMDSSLLSEFLSSSIKLFAVGSSEKNGPSDVGEVLLFEFAVFLLH